MKTRTLALLTLVAVLCLAPNAFAQKKKGGGGTGGGGGEEPTYLYQLVTLSAEAGIASSLNESSGTPALTEVVGQLGGKAHYWMLNDNPESPVVVDWDLAEHTDADAGSETLAVDITNQGVILGVGDVADLRTPLLWLNAISQPVALPVPANLDEVIITPVAVTDSGIVIGQARSNDDTVDADRTIVWRWHWEWVSNGDGNEVKSLLVSQPMVIDLALAFERVTEVNEQGWAAASGGNYSSSRVALNWNAEIENFDFVEFPLAATGAVPHWTTCMNEQDTVAGILYEANGTFEGAFAETLDGQVLSIPLLADDRREGTFFDRVVSINNYTEQHGEQIVAMAGTYSKKFNWTTTPESWVVMEVDNGVTKLSEVTDTGGLNVDWSREASISLKRINDAQWIVGYTKAAGTLQPIVLLRK